MKKLFLILMAAFAMTTMGACDKDNIDNPNPNSDLSTEEWVDLGLPSGLLWASCNLGANVPEGYGNYYSWGETKPKEEYSWSTYHYCTVYDDGSLQTLTKYNNRSSLGDTDTLTVLQAMDDAATAAFGSGVRIPTMEEWLELVDNTSTEWTTVNGVPGRKFTATNGKSIFLPAAGSRRDLKLEDAGFYGRYWASMLGQDYPSRAWGYGFNAIFQKKGRVGRNNGLSVRPVRSASL